MLWNMGVAVMLVLVVWVGWPLGRPIALTLALSRRAGEGTGTVETRVALNFVHPLRAALRLHASPSLGEGEGWGVVCFTLGSRVRGNDGRWRE